jgi:hypothetical protein
LDWAPFVATLSPGSSTVLDACLDQLPAVQPDEFNHLVLQKIQQKWAAE